ncbi:hypothetical protein AC578_124 [Pseudocercospora eumusae]|uniref:Uncharacterized protein n=1 Tax=Pseudocercospora eumusae TaxID=321146 RepID=A0A139HP88_9PEZI|nr:hypothetical protein AC578_124 [Pseudocercospora eumusae]
MAAPIDQQLFTDAQLNPGTSLAAGPRLILQNGTFTFFCKTMGQPKSVTKDANRRQDKNYKNDVPRQLFATLTKPLFDLASKATPGFPQLPKLAIMHVCNKTNAELLSLLGLAITFIPKKEYDVNKDGIAAVITAPQLSPIPLHAQYTTGFPKSRNALQRRHGGDQFLDAVDDYLWYNPQQSPLAQYFPGQQPQGQQQPPPPPAPIQATVAAPNPPANAAVAQVNQSGPAAIAHPASQQVPQPSVVQATAINVAAPNLPANVGVSQVSQPAPAAVTYPAQQVQLPQAVAGQASAFPFAAPNAQASFGAPQLYQPGPAATTYSAPSMPLQQPGWNQAASSNSVAPNAPVNYGAGQPGHAAMMYPAQQMPAPPAHIDPRLLQCVNAGQGAPLISQAFPPFTHQGVDEVDELPVQPDQGAPGVEQDNQDPVEETEAFGWDDLLIPDAYAEVDEMNPQPQNDAPKSDEAGPWDQFWDEYQEFINPDADQVNAGSS